MRVPFYRNGDATACHYKVNHKSEQHSISRKIFGNAANRPMTLKSLTDDKPRAVEFVRTAEVRRRKSLRMQD